MTSSLRLEKIDGGEFLEKKVFFLVIIIFYLV
jgi:hypothetical protein